jgi:CelD/BcsL family acetyltransferase involved in cellulose biosynthesis
LDIQTHATPEAGEWSRLVEQDEAATFFHMPQWADLLTSTLPGFRAAHIVALDGHALVGLVPALERSRLGATTLESMAFGTFGGPAVAGDAPEGTVSKLLAAFVRSAGSVKVGLAQVVDRSGRVTDRDLPGFSREDDLVQVVRLDADYEELFDRFHRSARNKIRKAVKSGVIVRRAVGEEDFLAYHSVLEECSRDWNVRPRPGVEFFSALSTLDRDAVQMWLAVHDGRVIAGDLNFVAHGVVMNWGNVSTDAARALAPNNLLHANAIERGIADGHSVYDLGSSAGIEGVRAFKASFGTVDVQVARFTREKAWYRGAKRAAGR